MTQIYIKEMIQAISSANIAKLPLPNPLSEAEQEYRTVLLRRRGGLDIMESLTPPSIPDDLEVKSTDKSKAKRRNSSFKSFFKKLLRHDRRKENKMDISAIVVHKEQGSDSDEESADYNVIVVNGISPNDILEEQVTKQDSQYSVSNDSPYWKYEDEKSVQGRIISNHNFYSLEKEQQLDQEHGYTLYDDTDDEIVASSQAPPYNESWRSEGIGHLDEQSLPLSVPDYFESPDCEDYLGMRQRLYEAVEYEDNACTSFRTVKF